MFAALIALMARQFASTAIGRYVVFNDEAGDVNVSWRVIVPDEGHCVLKPQNVQFRYKTSLDWLAQWMK